MRNAGGMQNEECRMQNQQRQGMHSESRTASRFSILHSAFCVLHSKTDGPRLTSESSTEGRRVGRVARDSPTGWVAGGVCCGGYVAWPLCESSCRRAGLTLARRCEFLSATAQAAMGWVE